MLLFSNVKNCLFIIFFFWLQLFNFTYANNCQYVEYSYQNYNITIYICSNDGIYNNNIETGIKNYSFKIQ